MADIANYAAIHKHELFTEIANADAATLDKIDADLAREGWAEEGVARKTIRARRQLAQ